MYHTTLTKKWQMTIPKQVRKALGLTHPGRIVVGVEPKRKAFMINQPPSLFDLAGTFTPKDKRKIIDAVKTREFFETRYERT